MLPGTNGLITIIQGRRHQKHVIICFAAIGT